MLENIINSILLALHNIALVGCAAAPFYNRNLVLKRSQYGPKLHYELDKVVEDTLQGNVPYCFAFVFILLATGIGMPMNHYLFQGALRQLHTFAMIAFSLKLLSFTGMVIIMLIIFTKINPKLSQLFSGFKPGEQPDTKDEQEFFAQRARRKKLCDICLWFALGILVFSAFLGFGA